MNTNGMNGASKPELIGPIQECIEACRLHEQALVELPGLAAKGGGRWIGEMNDVREGLRMTIEKLEGLLDVLDVRPRRKGTGMKGKGDNETV